MTTLQKDEFQKGETTEIEVEVVDDNKSERGVESSEIQALAAIELDKTEERHLLWKLDRHIAPVAMGLYLIAFLDRANIGNAAVGGMVTDLNFPANGLSVATSIFYVTYVIFVSYHQLTPLRGAHPNSPPPHMRSDRRGTGGGKDMTHT